MSATTYTSAIQHQEVWGNRRIHVIKFTITSYGTEGIPLTTATTGLAEVDFPVSVVLDVSADVANGPVNAIYTATTKIFTFIKATGTLVDDATAFNVYVTVMGG
jgi:hypothetical protein